MSVLAAREWVGDRIGNWAEESRLGHLADRLFNWSGMSRHDSRAWAAARDMDDIGRLTMDWLYGRLHQTPGHCAPPCDETLPYIHVIADANLSGFVTTCSQAGDSDGADSWSADVYGFVSEAALARMREAISGAGLVMETWCRGREHNGHTWTRGCPAANDLHFYALHCPSVAAEIRDAWFIAITDAEPNRNDRLWPALERFAELEPSS